MFINTIRWQACHFNVSLNLSCLLLPLRTYCHIITCFVKLNPVIRNGTRGYPGTPTQGIHRGQSGNQRSALFYQLLLQVTASHSIITSHRMGNFQESWAPSDGTLKHPVSKMERPPFLNCCL